MGIILIKNLKTMKFALVALLAAVEAADAVTADPNATPPVEAKDAVAAVTAVAEFSSCQDKTATVAAGKDSAGADVADVPFTCNDAAGDAAKVLVASAAALLAAAYMA